MTSLGRSELHMRRALLAAIAAFDLVGLVSTQTVVGRLDPLPLPDWYRLLFVIGFLTPVAAAAVGAFAGPRWLHRATVAAFVGTVAPVAVLLVLAIVDPALEGQLPWLISSAGAAASVAVLAWGTRGGWLALGGITVANWTISALVHDLVPHRVSNDTQALVFAVVGILLIAALLRSSQAIDRATEDSVRAAESRAVAEARRTATERARTIVHDDVLGTLLQAARGTPEVDAMLVAPAAVAAARIRDLAEPAVTGEVALGELRRRLAELVRVEVPAASFVERVGPAAPATLPAAAALALADAARQALVNTRRHAPGAAVTLTLIAGVGGVRVLIADDGPGFDPAGVGPDRLGISASILGRLRAVPGGEASVESARGTGTTVALGWQDPDAGGVRDGDAVPAAPRRGWPVAVVPHGLGGDQRIALTILLVAMTALSVYSAAIVDEPWVPAAAIVLLLLGLAVLGWIPLRRPGLARSLVAVALAIGAASLVAAGDIADYRLMTGWYATGAAFVMSVLAMRGRPRLAAVGVLIAVAVAGALSAVRGASLVDIVSVLFRPVLIGVGVALVVLLLVALARRVRRMSDDAVAAASAEAWREAEQAELRERWAGLDAFIGPTLDRLAEGRPLSPAERQECALLEGALRDRYRGARLAREPLVSAARRARARGVDVVLLDDAPGEHIDEGELLEIANWLAAFLDGVASGACTGRILPADRPGRASATSETEATLFRGGGVFSPA